MYKSIIPQITSLPIILFLLFLVLKLSKAIAWKWVWVCSPLWVSFVLPLVLLALLAIFIGVTLTGMVIIEMLK